MNDNYTLPEALRTQFKAVLFDLDGTILDSEEVHYYAYTKAMKEYGYDFAAMTEEISYRGSFRQMFMDIAKKNQFKESERDSIYKRKSELTLQIPATSVDAIEGIVSYLELLKELEVPMSVVTNSDRDYTDYALGSHGLTGFFEDIITADEVENIKPHPEGFLTASKLLEVKPTECLVFENTDAGIMSAAESGMKVIAIRGTDIKGFSTYEAASLVIDNYAEPSLDHLLVTGRHTE